MRTYISIGGGALALECVIEQSIERIAHALETQPWQLLKPPEESAANGQA